MRHFSAEDWIDFARGSSGPVNREAMEKHLAGGCEECNGTLKYWTLTARTARRAAEHQPPEDLVRSVKGMGALGGLPKLRSTLTVLAELVLDSFGAPAAMGFRSTRQSPRVILYRSGPTFIDLRIEEIPGTSRLCVVGQVLNSLGLTKAVAGAHVLVVSGAEKVRKVVTNRFGEFQLELESAAGIRLSVQIDDKEVVVPLEQASAKLENRIGY